MASTSETIELEGTWEEILQHADALAGRRVRVTVLPPDGEGEGPPLKPANQRMLEWLHEQQRHPLPEEELKVLEEMEQHRREQRLRLYGPDGDS